MSPIFLQYLLGLKIFIIRTLEDESWSNWNSVAAPNWFGSFKEPPFPEHFTNEISVTLIWGHFTAFMELSHLLTRISLIKPKMSNCFHSLVGMSGSARAHVAAYVSSRKIRWINIAKLPRGECQIPQARAWLTLMPIQDSGKVSKQKRQLVTRIDSIPPLQPACGTWPPWLCPGVLTSAPDKRI